MQRVAHSSACRAPWQGYIHHARSSHSHSSKLIHHWDHEPQNQPSWIHLSYLQPHPHLVFKNH
ncbi:unnamed protein product [Prunus brigantina]